MNRESATQYFSQKTNVLLWLMGIVGVCMVYIGYTGERRSVIFMVVGVLLVALCVYEIVHERLHKRTGAQLDAAADDAAAMRNLFGCALRQLCLAADDVKNCEKISLVGYCAMPIRTRPYFRRDETDGRLRSSNYQTSMLIFCPDRFYSYTYVMSLVDKETSESGRMWRYDQLAEARLVREDFSYLVGASDEKRESAPIEYLFLKDTDGHGFSFFFDRTPQADAAVRRVLELLEKRSADESAIEAEHDAVSEALTGVLDGQSRNSAAKGRDLGVGVIGDRLVNPNR